MTKEFEQFLQEAALEKEHVDLINSYTDRNHNWKDMYDFAHSKLNFDENQRAYIPFENNEKIEPHPDVKSHLEKHGYEIEDYGQNKAKHPEKKNSINIGKVLTKTGATPELINKFTSDPSRKLAKKSDHHIVISMNPHDIGRMSTNQGWSSCMDLKKCDKYFNNPDISPRSKREEIHKLGSSHPNLTSAYQPYMQKYGNPNL